MPSASLQSTAALILATDIPDLGQAQVDKVARFETRQRPQHLELRTVAANIGQDDGAQGPQIHLCRIETAYNLRALSQLAFPQLHQLVALQRCQQCPPANQVCAFPIWEVQILPDGSRDRLCRARGRGAIRARRPPMTQTILARCLLGYWIGLRDK